MDKPGNRFSRLPSPVLYFPCSFKYFATSSSVANHTPGFDFIYVINLSTCTILDRCPEMCGCIVNKNSVPSSYAPSNSALYTSNTDSGCGIDPSAFSP